MSLQNRVDPFGRIVADPGRGTLTGNRGILHDDHRRVVRSHASPAWITCVLEWRGRRRAVMVGRTWTELFFLDEATALAAGHRPCAYCRRRDYDAFVGAWSRGNPALAPTSGRRAPVVDRVLHGERRTSHGEKRVWSASARSLPPGAMISLSAVPNLVVERGLMRPWSFSGYGSPQGLPDSTVDVLSPRTIVEAIRSGYRPGMHPSAGDQGSMRPAVVNTVSEENRSATRS